MDKQKIYDKILELANKNFNENTVITRSDIAWELKELGIENDSPEVSKFVWECFQKSNNKEIFKSLVNNEKNSTITDEYQIPALLETDSQDDVFKVLTQRLKDAGLKISGLENLTAEKAKSEILRQSSALLEFLSGTRSIEKIKNDAQQVFEKYSQLTSSYSDAKNSVKEITKDFVNIRGNSVDIFRRYALALTDIFGDKIKAAMPEVFDFDSVEFLDTESMLKNVELSFNSVFGKCGELAGEISDNFSSVLKLSATQVGKAQDKRLGVALAGVNLISHYIKTSQKASVLKTEVQELKNSISKDTATIKIDEVRLAEIFKLLNDNYIPKAEIFAKAAPEVLDNELKQLINAVYSTSEAKDLKQKRDTILSEMSALEKIIADSGLNVNYYSGHISESKATLESLEETYQNAKTSQPEAPSGFTNVISFGSKKKEYERKVYDWKKNCEPLISRYEDLLVDVKIDGEELEKQKEIFESSKKRFAELKFEADKISKQLSQISLADDQTKAKIISRLEDIIKLLHIAKEISSSKLEERLVKKTSVKDFKKLDLPENLASAVNDFKEQIRQNLNFSAQDAEKIAGKGVNKENIDKITSQGNEILQRSFDICNRMASLEAMKINYALSNEYYQNEFEKIKAQFTESIKNIDDKNAFLLSIAQKVNTSENKEELKKSLFLLLDSDYQKFTPEDWDLFLSGKKNIEI